MLSVAFISHFISLILDLLLNTEPEPGVMPGESAEFGVIPARGWMDETLTSGIFTLMSHLVVFSKQSFFLIKASSIKCAARLTLAITKKTVFPLWPIRKL